MAGAFFVLPSGILKPFNIIVTLKPSRKGENGMQPHLIISDIDGTLAVNHTTVTDITVKRLNQLMSQGHQFYVASGRMYALAEAIATQVSDQAQVIAANGAVYDFHGARTHHRLGASALEVIEQAAADHQVTVVYFGDDTVYYTKEPSRAVTRMLSHYTDPRSGLKVEQVYDVDGLLAKQAVINNGFVVSPGLFKSLAGFKQQVAKSDLVHLSSSGKDNVELIPQGVDKATALVQLQEKTGIPAERTIVFGDGENDIGMMQVAGVSVAMGNAVPAVKRIASAVTDSNVNDGVARFLADYFSL